VNFAVPTGNFGDVFAGYLAKRMGLPIGRLIIATNSNDIMARFVHTGVYAAGEVFPTLSPAMDIQIASNFERYLYYLHEEDAAAVRALLETMHRTGHMAVGEILHRTVAADFDAAAVDDAATLEQIRATHAATGYILDPHTAVGVRAAAGMADCVCLATAHPAKFNEAVTAAIGQEAAPPASLQGLMDKPTRCAVLDNDLATVKRHIVATLTERAGA
jgi:threonine synthase